MTSGVSTMSREIVVGTIDKYDWVQLGGAIKHPEVGKIVIVDEDIREKTGVEDASLKIIPSNGYGNIIKLRNLIDSEKPDAILHFTDPHYWRWLYEAEHEIRQNIPILYYHVWDNIPDPIYNRDYYESCDWIGCISKQTYGIVRRVSSSTESHTYKPLLPNQVSYVPHGINSETFKPLDVVSDETKSVVYNGKEYDFILFFNNRNIRRKQPSDIIHSYKLFCDSLPKEKSERCLLLMHTTPVDPNGTDLNEVIKHICPMYEVRFTHSKFEQDQLNEIYNLVDCTINIANAEGFGLGTAESLMSGTPIIVNVTGGLQDQCGFNYDAEDYIDKVPSLNKKNLFSNEPHGEWVVPIWSSVNSLAGSSVTPFIYEDKVSIEDVVSAIRTVYDWGRDERKRRGGVGREFALNNLSSKVMCDLISKGIDETIANFKPRKKYDLYKIV